MLFLGWPMYLFGNYTGPAKNKGGNNSHFNPWSKLFTERQVPLVALSVAGVAAVATLLLITAKAYGAAVVVMWFGCPYLVVNALLVIVTYLQHTDEHVPHYRAPAFTWLRGALSTVDRSFGYWLDDASHHIADSHVVHHLFHTVRSKQAVVNQRRAQPLCVWYSPMLHHTLLNSPPSHCRCPSTTLFLQHLMCASSLGRTIYPATAPCCRQCGPRSVHATSSMMRVMSCTTSDLETLSAHMRCTRDNNQTVPGELIARQPVGGRSGVRCHRETIVCVTVATCLSD